METTVDMPESPETLESPEAIIKPEEFYLHLCKYRTVHSYNCYKKVRDEMQNLMMRTIGYTMLVMIALFLTHSAYIYKASRGAPALRDMVIVYDRADHDFMVLKGQDATEFQVYQFNGSLGMNISSGASKRNASFSEERMLI